MAIPVEHVTRDLHVGAVRLSHFQFRKDYEAGLEFLLKSIPSVGPLWAGDRTLRRSRCFMASAWSGTFRRVTCFARSTILPVGRGTPSVGSHACQRGHDDAVGNRKRAGLSGAKRPSVFMMRILAIDA
jgi:hypothetical protein